MVCRVCSKNRSLYFFTTLLLKELKGSESISAPYVPFKINKKVCRRIASYIPGVRICHILTVGSRFLGYELISNNIYQFNASQYKISET